MFDGTSSEVPGNACGVCVVHKHPRIFWQHLHISGERSNRAVSRKHPIRQQDQPRSWSTAADRSCEVIRISVIECKDWTFKKLRGVPKGRMRLAINQYV